MSKELRNTLKYLAGRFCRLTSGHATIAPLPQGEMGIDRLGRMLVVRTGAETEQRTPVRGVLGVGVGGLGALEKCGEGGREGMR